MKEIKVRFTPEDLVVLDAQAFAAGISRAELIRSRALVTECNHGLTTAAYHQLVSAAATHVRGDIPRRMVEHLIAFVITWISSQSRQSNHPSSTDSMTP